MLFIQVGNRDINMAQVTDIYYRQDRAQVTLALTTQDGDGAACITLTGESARAFEETWRAVGIAGVTLYKVC